MIGKLKSLFGARRSAGSAPTEQLPDLASRPMTQALLTLASRLTADATSGIREMVGKIAPVPELPTLDARVKSAINVVTIKIVMDAQKAATGESVYLPGQPLPREAAMVVAFGILVIAAVTSPIKAEGSQFDQTEFGASLINAMFMMHTLEERGEVFKQGVAIFRKVSTVDLPNVREWIDNVFQLARGYIAQTSSDDPRLTQTQFAPLFGSMLKTFLSSAN